MEKEINFILSQLKIQYRIQESIVEYIQRMPVSNSSVHVKACQDILHLINDQIECINKVRFDS